MRIGFLYIAIVGILLLGSGCEKWNLQEKDFPEVITLDAFFTSTTSLVFFAEVNGLTKSIATDHGFVWSKTQTEPTIQTNDGIIYLGPTGSGEFNHEVSNLDRNQTYYFRAFVIHQGNTYFGETIEALTGDAVLITTGIDYSGGKELDLVGELYNLDPGVGATQYGHCWSFSSPEPQLENSTFSNLGKPTQDGFFYTPLEDLTSGQQIYFRSYMLTNLGNDTLYGEVQSEIINLVDVWDYLGLFPDPDYGGGISFVLDNEAYVGLPWSNNQNKLWKFNPSDGSWTQMADYPGVQSYFAVSFVIDNAAYAGLGRESRAFYKYQNNSWQQIEDFPGDTYFRGIGFSALGKGYAGLGFIDNTFTTMTDELYKYDPQSGWETTPILYTGPASINSPFVFQVYGQVVVVGGAVTPFVFVFDPVTETWSQRANFPGGNLELGVGFSIGETGFVAAGFQGTYGWTDKLWSYDYLNDSWERKASLPGKPRRLSSGFVLDGKAYIVGGSMVDGSAADVWRYTPE